MKIRKREKHAEMGMIKKRKDKWFLSKHKIVN